MCTISSLSVCPMREEHLDGVQALSSSLNASSDLLTDVSNYLQAGRDPLNQVTEHTCMHRHTHTQFNACPNHLYALPVATQCRQKYYACSSIM